MKLVSFRTNMAANLAGMVVPSMLSFLIVPIYIRQIGAEGYGLVGFLISLQAILTILDLGLGLAINRELSRHAALDVPAESSRNLLRTLELIYFAMAFLVGASVIALSPLLARLLNAEHISSTTLREIVVLMGLIVAARWPVSLYAGVLRARDRQTALNAVIVVEAALRGVGGALLLLLVSNSVRVPFLCFLGSAALQLVALKRLAWKAMPEAETRPRFQHDAFRAVRRFTVHTAAASLLATALKQSDTLLVATLLPLASLGYYTTAWTMCTALLLLSTTTFASLVPRLSLLLAGKRSDEIRAVYHDACQLVAFGIAPLGCVLVFFSHDFLLLWTRSVPTASAADTAMTILALAFLLNALMQPPLALQVAAGYMTLQIKMNLAGVLLFIPVMYIALRRFGIAGAGTCWLLFNTASFVVAPFLMHRRFLKSEYRQWLLRDCAPFVLTAGLFAFLGYVVARRIGGTLSFIPVSAVVLVAYVLATWRWCLPVARNVRRAVHRRRAVISLDLG